MMHVDKYYSVKQYNEERYAKISRQMGFKAKTIAEYKIWKVQLLDQLRVLLGFDNMEQCSLSPEIIETTPCKGYTREKVIIETEPDIYMPVYVLIPDNDYYKSPKPVMIAAHGHCSGGKYSVAGIRGIPPVAEAIKLYNYNYGEQFVKEGFIVFCPDARGFGERRESSHQGDTDESFMSWSCYELNNSAIALGQTVTGMWTWDLMRLVDYISTRADCNPGRIGCCGLSGGGLQTLWLSAIDERIQCAAISGYFYGYKESLLNTTNCSCNYIPGLYRIADMGDIAALIAPRPLIIETGSQDQLNGKSGLENVTSQFQITKKAYSLLGKDDCIYHDVFTGGHKWNGVYAIPWFNRWLGREYL